MAMNKGGTAQVERGEGLGWPEGLWLMVVGKKPRLRQQSSPHPHFSGGFFFSLSVLPSVFLGFCKCQPFTV